MDYSLLKSLLIIMFSSIIINNYVLSRFLGICPFLGVSKKLDSAAGMGVSVTLVMIIATVVTWPIQTYLLEPNGLGYLQTLVFILVIASLVQMIDITLKKCIPALHKALGVYLPLITTNCAVLGVTLNNFTETNYIGSAYSYLEAIFNAAGVGLGFLLAMVLFAGVRSRIDESKVPSHFRGLAITLVAASFLSLVFFGFAGVVNNLFGIGA